MKIDKEDRSLPLAVVFYSIGSQAAFLSQIFLSQKRGMSSEQNDYVSSARTRRVSKRLLAGGRPHPSIEMKKADLSVCYFYGADYVSRQKQLITVFGVANAQK